MEIKYDSWANHLKQGKLAPVYLLVGEEHLLVLEAADALRKLAREQGYTEREVLESSTGYDWNNLFHASGNMSLFASRRIVDLRIPTGRPGTEGAAAIKEWLDSPPADTILLITAMQWSKSHKTAWVDAAAAAGIFMVIWPLKKASELEFWIKQRSMAKGLVLTADAVSLLASRIEGNLLAAAQEIDKLALLANGTVDANELESLVADHSRFDVFTLSDSILEGQTERALQITASLRAEGEQVAGMTPWLSNQLAVVAKVAQVSQGRDPSSALQKERIWATKVAMFRKALSRGDAQFWEDRLNEIGIVDRIAKGRRTGDAWVELERLIVRATQRKAIAKFA